MKGGAFTVIVIAFVAVPPPLFATLNVTLVVPAVVGVPLTTPVLLFKDKPAGKVLPWATLYVRLRFCGSEAVT